MVGSFDVLHLAQDSFIKPFEAEPKRRPLELRSFLETKLLGQESIAPTCINDPGCLETDGVAAIRGVNDLVSTTFADRYISDGAVDHFNAEFPGAFLQTNGQGATIDLVRRHRRNPRRLVCRISVVGGIVYLLFEIESKTVLVEVLFLEIRAE